MEYLALLALSALLYWLVSSRRRSTHSSAPRPHQADISPSGAVVTTSDRTSVGALTPTDKGGWIINPLSSYPLTIEGIDRKQAEAFRSLCEEERYSGTDGLTRALIPLIARSNLHCREVDDYVAEYRPKYRAALQSLKEHSKEWQVAGELDRRDLLPELQEAALRRLAVRPDCDLIALFESELQDATYDDALLDHYGMDIIQFYLRYAGDLRRVHVIPASYDAFRKSFEQLAQVGLAARGKEIPIRDILNTLKLKDMPTLVSDLSPPKWNRKSQAIDYLAAVPDILERAGKAVAFRELFQLKPLPNEFSQIDLALLSASWRHVEAIAWLIARTYIGGALYLRELERDRVMRKGHQAEMEWQQDQNPCPVCVQATTRQPTIKNRPKTPFHIGCRCWVLTDRGEDY